MTRPGIVGLRRTLDRTRSILTEIRDELRKDAA